MAGVILEGHTLGHKHRNYNKIVIESIAHQPHALKDIDFNEDDVNNLIKVDIASVNRNVEYIVEVLKGNDMLYVSRAMSQCPWLITDNAYAHIINPDYIHSHLIPVMMAKTANKLMLHIRLSLRDENRVETFFNYYENFDLKTALKWLPHCSVLFIEIKVKKYIYHIRRHLLKRLCEKSHRILEVYVKSTNGGGFIRDELQETMFLLNTHTEFYLDLVETRREYECPKFNSKCTKILMKACPERVTKNFARYGNRVHLETFVKFLNTKEVKDFLLRQANAVKRNYSSWINYKNVQHFIQRMPQEDQLKFIGDVFINKCFKKNEGISGDSSSEGEDEEDVVDDENSAMMRLYNCVTRCGRGKGTELLHWYNFIPFETALNEVKEKLKKATEKDDRNELLKFLTRIAGHKPQDLEKLLQYYNDNYSENSKNDHMRFIKNLMDHTNVLRYNSKCWSLLKTIFSAINIGIEKDCSDYDDDEQTCIGLIIIHELINNNEVPEMISKQFKFNSLKQYSEQMNSDEQNLLFDYLYNNLLNKIKQQDFNNHVLFKENIKLMKCVLQLLKDYKKNLAEYPYVINKIKELIKTKEENALKDSLSWIYNISKNWRKYLFEESIILCPSERVCINALKHDPGLLSRYESIVSAMRYNDNVTLKQLLIKVKVYWPDSLASEWSQEYRDRLTQPQGHKSLIRGLTFLLPQRELSDIINVYKPEDSKINWEHDEILIRLRKHIAQTMHYARPQPTPDDILQYAKGDYLQFALPSLNAILYNLCPARCQMLIPRLLDSPVSLQKHGIRIAFVKMHSEDLQRIFSIYWKTTNNLSIRAVIFKLTFELLCKGKDDAKIANIWSLLKVFIDALTFKEDKTIYERLMQVHKVPLSVRPLYVMKSYTFLKALISKSDLDKPKYEQALDSLIHVIDELVESMESEFIANIFREYYAAVYTKEKTGEFVHRDLMQLLASYITCTRSEEEQSQRYTMVLLPILKYTTSVWEEKDKKDIVKINIRNLLRNLRSKLKYVISKDMVVPVTTYAEIQKELELSLSPNVAYIMLREWKLTVAFANNLNDNKDSNCWDAVCMRAAPQFGKTCLEFLKEDIKMFFPCIDEYFSKALSTVLGALIGSESNVITEILKNMLTEEITQSYLVAIRTSPRYYFSNSNKELPELHKIILSHQSLEVKMHYYHKNKDSRHIA